MGLALLRAVFSVKRVRSDLQTLVLMLRLISNHNPLRKLTVPHKVLVKIFWTVPGILVRRHPSNGTGRLLAANPATAFVAQVGYFYE